MEALIITPAFAGSDVVIPAGVAVRGSVVEAIPSTKPDARGVLHLLFTEIVGPEKKPIALKARVVEVDNARESIDEAGKIIGILASETFAARIEQGIEKVSQKNSGLASVLAVARGAVLTKEAPSGEINYGPGIEMKIRLMEALHWPGGGTPFAVKAVEDEAGLYALVNRQPFRTVAEKPPKPSDLTNLMFVATEAGLQRAFKEAGWVLAHELNAESMMETVRAIAAMRGYSEAPMSKLLLDGKRSDFDFQKGNNTFDKRHHLRIWRRPETFEGKPVWVCAATHDIDIQFSQQNRTFIHVIDGLVDRERGKVVSDLLFTGRVQSMALVDRPDVPVKMQNATGDDVETDGRMAVLVLE